MNSIYKPLPILSDKEILELIKKNDINEVMLLPLSVGEYHPNWKYAQDICVKLSEYPDERVRANAILGLAYVARTKRKLEKYIVKPVLLKALQDNKEYEWRIIDAINDINIFMNWDIGKKALERVDE